MKNEKYILYGASFNPPHIGHFSAISQMLEDYDKVIVFPYPKKFIDGKQEVLPPIKQRMKMLEIFCLDFFPQMADRLMLVNLAAEIKPKTGEILHTYDYLQHVKKRLPMNATLSVCLGFDVNNLVRKENFYNENSIKNEFPHFYLQEENKIKSEDLRKFFSNNKNIKSKKDEEYVIYAVGNALANHIFEHNLYGIKKKESIASESLDVPSFGEKKKKSPKI